jgi:hypothetical protein
MMPKLSAPNDYVVPTFAEEQRLRRIVYESVSKAILRLIREETFRKYQGSKWRDFQNKIEQIFSSVLYKRVNEILKAAKIKPSVGDALRMVAEKRKEARKKLAGELKGARNKLKEINIKLNESRKNLSRIQSSCSTSISGGFRVILPKPCDAQIRPSEAEELLPNGPGLYFFWDPELEVWAYVGKSVRLSERCRMGTHHILKNHYRIAFIEIDNDNLAYAEVVYMAILRPILNFGGRFYNKGEDSYFEC